MTIYDTADMALSGSAPVELFAFEGPQRLYLTTAQTPITYLGNTYEPGFVHHYDIEQTEELNKQALTIMLRNDNSVIQDFLVSIPVGVTPITIFRYIIGVNEFRQIWSGRMSSVNFGSDGIAECQCEPIFTTLKRVGLRAHYQVICRHDLYSVRCGVDRTFYTRPATVAAVDGMVVILNGISSQPSGYYTVGYLRKDNTTRMIVNHTGSTVQLAGPIIGLSTRDSVEVTAGCQRTTAECESKFSNILNYGGFPYIPPKNPFNGDAIV